MNTWMAVLLVAALLLMGSGCTTLSAGKKYTLAKVDRKRFLVEPNRVLETEGQTDDFDKVNPAGNFGIVINSGYIPYLQSIKRPMSSWNSV